MYETDISPELPPRFPQPARTSPTARLICCVHQIDGISTIVHSHRLTVPPDGLLCARLKRAQCIQDDLWPARFRSFHLTRASQSSRPCNGWFVGCICEAPKREFPHCSRKLALASISARQWMRCMDTTRITQAIYLCSR